MVIVASTCWLWLALIVLVDLSLISFLVDATVKSLDDAVLPAANWVLELLDDADGLKDSTKVTITADLILSFQNTVGKPFVAD